MKSLKRSLKKYLIHKLLEKLQASDHSIFDGLGEKDKKLVSKIKLGQLTYLSKNRLASIILTCRKIERLNLTGIMLEAGCALGGSTILIGKLKKKSRPFIVHDVFGMIPPPGDKDGTDVHKRYKNIATGKAKGLDGNKYYGYEQDLYKTVWKNLDAFGIKEKQDHVKLVRGLLQNTMKVDSPVVFAHIDVDWYDPVRACLERIVPRLVVGGSLILDDYHDWSGCRKATDEYFLNISDNFIMEDSAGTLKITRIFNT